MNAHMILQRDNDIIMIINLRMKLLDQFCFLHEKDIYLWKSFFNLNEFFKRELLIMKYVSHIYSYFLVY